MNIIIKNLPEFVLVDGEKYRINTDFRVWIRFNILILESSLSTVEKIIDAIKLCYIDSLPPSLDKAVSAILEFYNPGREPKIRGGGDGYRRIYSFSQDSEYIYSAFYEQYGIDLSKADLHWWQFRALFRGLGDKTEFSKIVGYRAADLSKVKDKAHRNYLRRMKDIYRLSDFCTNREKDMYFANVISGVL